MKTKHGYLPEPFEEEDEESEFRRRRYFRPKPARRKLKRWPKGHQKPV